MTGNFKFDFLTSITTYWALVNILKDNKKSQKDTPNIKGKEIIFDELREN